MTIQTLKWYHALHQITGDMARTIHVEPWHVEKWRKMIKEILKEMKPYDAQPLRSVVSPGQSEVVARSKNKVANRKKQR